MRLHDFECGESFKIGDCGKCRYWLEIKGAVNLGAPKESCEFAHGEADAGGAAVGAVAAAFDVFAEFDEFGEFGLGEFVACFDGGFAGHHVEDVAEGVFGGGIVGERTSERASERTRGKRR